MLVLKDGGVLSSLPVGGKRGMARAPQPSSFLPPHLTGALVAHEHALRSAHPVQHARSMGAWEVVFLVDGGGDGGKMIHWAGRGDKSAGKSA